MTPEQKAWIDGASYEDLLRKWRFAPAGDPMFVGDTGEYFKAVMARKRAENPDGAVRASQDIGW
jgi:hypothetical protein